MFHSALGCVFAAITTAMVWCQAATADVWHVPKDFATIQQAINAADDGDAIHIAAGTYSEAIEIDNKSLVITGEGADRTIIDASAMDATAVLIVGPTAVVELASLQVTGGLGDGGGLVIDGAEVHVRDCIMANNTGTQNGGGVRIVNSLLVSFVRCRFEGNVASGAGGAIILSPVEGSQLIVSECEFEKNHSDFGGAIAIASALNMNISVRISDCDFLGNTSDGWGGAITINHLATATLRNNTFRDNTAEKSGGAMFVKGSVDMAHCVFENNHAAGGGAVSFSWTNSSSVPPPRIHACQFLENSAFGGGAIYVENRDIDLSDSQFYANDVAHAMGRGGAIRICNFGSSYAITANVLRCEFMHNMAFDGGAIYSCNNNGVIAQNTFDSNTSINNAGAVQAIGTTVAHCTFRNNSAGQWGGGIRGGYLISNFFEGNSASVGGAIYGAHALTSNVVCGNSPNEIGGTYQDHGENVISDSCKKPVEHHVPRDFLTIQDAVDAAHFNDRIVIAHGVYHESVNLPNKRLHLYAPTGPEQTILDSSATGQRAIITDSTTAFGTTIEGLTITGGTNGGVQMNDHACLKFVNCIIRDNYTTESGAGLTFHLPKPTSNLEIVDCVFENNHGLVGAILAGTRSARIESTTFRHNSALLYGGAMVLGGGEVSDCVMENNSAGQAGGAVYISGGPYRFESCEFRNNHAPLGGAIRSNSTMLTVVNSLFCANQRDDIEGQFIDAGGNEFDEACEGDCPGDLVGNGAVGVSDLLVLLAAWGNCPGGLGCAGDLNFDGIVDVADLLILLGSWGICP